MAILGHFPFLPKLRKRANELWVIEKNPHPGDFAEHEAEDLIPKANVFGLTGTAFTNHTLERLLKLCQPGTYVVLLGDTAPLSPILFDYGIDAASSSKVVNPERAMRCISEGANFRQIKGTQRLTMMKEKL